ncbi:MAG: amidohydrolase family protein, partial [Deltaproteobacteria bacterium]|nr:amidohydrolase family protein [Deltaproteobacteria bacterium]
MKLARFIIDTHVHAQRHAPGPEFKKLGMDDPKKIRYNDLAQIMPTLKTYENSKRLLYDMECYGVDMCILHPAFGMSNEINLELVEKYPDKFVALATPKNTVDKARTGEIEWSFDTAMEELDGLLATGKFVGIGEGMPTRPYHVTTEHQNYSQTERMDDLRKVMELGRKYAVPVRVHTGSPMGYQITYSFWPENFHPNWVRDLAAEYPDVSIIFDHGCMQGGKWDTLVHE